MKKLICAFLILTSSLAFAQTTKDVLLKSNLRQTEKFLFPKDPQKRIDFFKTKFYENQDLSEKANALVETEILENFNRKNEKNQKIRSLFAGNFFKSAQLDSTLMDSVYFFSFKTSEDSTLTAKIFFTYHTDGNQETYLMQELDTITQQFKNTTKNEFFFDQNNRDTLNITYIWNNESYDWMNKEKYLNVYDDEGNKTLSVLFMWQNLSKQWIGQFMFQYKYDTNNNQTLNAYYTWSDVGNAWQGYYKSEYIYDENNKLLLSANYQWDIISINWIGSNKTEFDYDANGNQNSMVNSVWEENKNDWKYQSKLKSHYENDGTNFYNSSENYSWDENRETWIGLYKYVYYGNVDNESNSINYVWNNVDEIWEPSEKNVSKWDEKELKNSTTHYLARDSIIHSKLINGFNRTIDISKIWITPSCTEQTCTTLDSDVAEGDSSILWNYNIVGSFNSDSGFCQIQLDNNIDLSDNSGLFLNYKVIKPSNTTFIIMLTEASGEVWKFQSSNVLNEVKTGWQQFVIPFSNFFQKINYIDGYLNTDSIVKIEFRLYGSAGSKTTGSLLLDNFSTYDIKKTDTWIVSSVDEEIRDKYENLISITSSRWDSLKQVFIPFYKFKNDIIYNVNGQILQNQTSYWKEFNENWTNEMKQINEYDDSGNLTKMEAYVWNESIKNWSGNWKSETDWDEFGNMIFSASYQWNYESQNWLPYNKIENSYNSTGTRLMDSFYMWNIESKSWIGNYKSETFLNDNQEVIKTINYSWDFLENDWLVTDINLSTRNFEMYNEEGLLSSISYTVWDENLKVWSSSEKYYLYYSSHSISTNNKPLKSIENEIVEVYPNPASEVIYIRLKNEIYSSSYSLFNSLGQLQKNDFITDEITTMQINNLPHGTYILVIDINNTFISRKIILH
jgi:hypothetical protein